MVLSHEQILDLTVRERLELIDAIWATIDDTPEGFEISDELARELDRRYEAHLRNPEASITWEALRARLDASD